MFSGDSRAPGPPTTPTGGKTDQKSQSHYRHEKQVGGINHIKYQSTIERERESDGYR